MLKIQSLTLLKIDYLPGWRWREQQSKGNCLNFGCHNKISQADGLSNRNLFFTVLKAGKCWYGQFLMRTALLAYRQLPPGFIPAWQRHTHRENKFSDICSYKGTNPIMGFPGGSVVKNLPANAGDAGRIPRFDPCIRRSSWRRKWQPIPVILPRKSHGERNLVGHSPWQVTKSGIQLTN